MNNETDFFQFATKYRSAFRRIAAAEEGQPLQVLLAQEVAKEEVEPGPHATRASTYPHLLRPAGCSGITSGWIISVVREQGDSFEGCIMKIKRLERMRDSQRAYHRQCQWVMEDGIYAPHSYAETSPDALSWWDDVGFILAGRRVIVWWVHPRQRYADEIDERAWSEAGEPPRDGGIFADSTPNYKRVGRSRKKIISHTMQPAQGELRQYYDKLDEITKRLKHDGIDFEVSPSWRRERLSWATGVELVAPLEVRNEAELKVIADLARRLFRGETTLEQAFPGYHYGKDQWLAEHEFLNIT